MKDVYLNCPIFESEKYKLRLISQDDSRDLLKVYCDKKAVQFFNSDNCSGDGFYYTSEKTMKDVINAWIYCYNAKDFVRWSVLDKHKKEAIGTIELFHRDAEDYFTECGLMRLDLRSDYENAEEIENILSLIITPAYEYFQCNKIATKVVPEAAERILAVKKLGFKLTDEKFLGNDGTAYESYYVRQL